MSRRLPQAMFLHVVCASGDHFELPSSTCCFKLNRGSSCHSQSPLLSIGKAWSAHLVAADECAVHRGPRGRIHYRPAISAHQQ
eukprot:11179703-Alexandrium_andersonii.AAC.1